MPAAEKKVAPKVAPPTRGDTIGEPVATSQPTENLVGQIDIDGNEHGHDHPDVPAYPKSGTVMLMQERGHTVPVMVVSTPDEPAGAGPAAPSPGTVHVGMFGFQYGSRPNVPVSHLRPIGE